MITSREKPTRDLVDRRLAGAAGQHGQTVPARGQRASSRIQRSKSLSRTKLVRPPPPAASLGGIDAHGRFGRGHPVVWHVNFYRSTDDTPADQALARWATEIVPAVREAIA